MDWLKKTPIVSLLMAVAIAAVPFLLARDTAPTDSQFEAARHEARAYLARKPRLQVDRVGELMLGAEWLEQMRETAQLSGRDDIELPARMLARSQAQLDALIEQVYSERMRADPVWRLGVIDAQTPGSNYFSHAFVHANRVGMILCIAVLFLVGVTLERVWGSLLFAALAGAAIPVTAHAYRLLDASTGVPWSGGAGLSAVLLGAYCIRGLGGHFTIPGWLLAPVWLGVEILAVRGVPIDDLGRAPWATLFAAFGVGALVAGTLRLLNVEAILDARSERTQRGPNPIVSRAARLRSDGDPYQAFDLIQAAWRDDPEDRDVAEAFYSIAVEVDQPEAAADAILPSLRRALRGGDLPRAIEYWSPLASRQCAAALEPTAAVRLGEALLDAGNPQEALFSLELALERGASAAHALRIVNVARDLDEDLTRRAATLALADPSLDPGSRGELEAIVSVPADAPAPVSEAAEPTVTESRSQLDRRVIAEHHSIETTAFPLEADQSLDLAPGEDLASKLPDAADSSPFEADALSAAHLAEEVAAPLDADALSSARDSDVLSHWNDAGALDPSALEKAEEEDEALDQTVFCANDLDTPDAFFGSDATDEMGLGSGETDSDRTPLIDSTDEMTSPMLEEGAQRASESECGDDAGESGDAFDRTTILYAVPQAPEAASPPPAAPMQLRALRAIDAVPVSMTDGSIEIDADGRGKSKLPINRIQAISLAAVRGIVSRPVLIVDCVLNWTDDIGSPMKLIRFRSDRFDPLRFTPGAGDALAALLRWVESLQQASGAHALPSPDALQGRFARFDSLEVYERDVLRAARDAAH